MPGLRQHNWKSVYRTGDDDLFNDFYMPALSCATRYDRAVGYFSSELLVAASKGLSRLVKANGKMRLVIGHPLDSDEYSAVKDGKDLGWIYEDLTTKLLRILAGDLGKIAKHRLELLTWMLACGTLEIKFAIRKMGMYHEKIGIITDESADRLIFTGSANETHSAMDVSTNAESISVYPSWNSEVFENYGEPFEQGFEALWNNRQRDTYTVAVPSEIYERVYANLDENGCPDLELEARLVQEIALETHVSEPFIPKSLNGVPFQIKEHQRKALEKWQANNYRGILELATGSGKTITSIYGAVKIYEASRKLAFVVAVPYQELAAQWVRTLKLFGVVPHECFGSKNSWCKRFKHDVQAFGIGAKNYIFAVVVNKTMQSTDFQELASMIPSADFMFVGDECHRHGAKQTAEALPDAAVRMGLSATPFRSEDDEIESPFPDHGRTRLLQYYGPVVDEYTLSDAINEGILTPYRYHVCGVQLTEEEQEEYEDLTQQITSMVRSNKVLRQADRDILTQLCGKRSRLLGSAKNKLPALTRQLMSLCDQDKGHVLVYCAEGSSGSENEYTKNIDKVSKLLNELGWRASQFTANENGRDRKQILDSFLSGGIDALVSMKVLDEGIDIPACKSAFILASTKNPRQYVQRRGRILRKFQGKEYATIYDFVTMPAEKWSGSPASKKLVRSEMERVNDFLLLAQNKREIYTELERLGIEL